MSRLEKIASLLKRHRNADGYYDDDFDEIDLKKAFGLEWIGGGISREVYRRPNGRTVFKIGDVNCNRTEWNLYKCAPAALRDLLAKPLRISRCGRVLEMEFMPVTLDKVRGDKSWELKDEFRSHVRRQKYYSLLGSDIHTGNVGVNRRGVMKMVDYGYLTDSCATFTQARMRKRLRKMKARRLRREASVGVGVYKHLTSQMRVS